MTDNTIVFDTETTGANAERDQIIEISIQSGLGEGALVKSWRIKPSVPISKEAQAVHGISNEDVANCPKFPALWPEFRDYFLKATVIIGYNVAFDIEFLQQELRRAQEPELDLSAVKVIDPFQIWRVMEPRRLESAVERFVGRKHSAAHSAEGDVIATAEVLQGMLKHFSLTNAGWDKLAEMSGNYGRDWVGPTKHLVWKDGQIVISFGKHRGTTIEQMIERDPSYLSWVAGKEDFAPHVREICAKAAKRDLEGFKGWVQQRFSPRK